MKKDKIIKNDELRDEYKQSDFPVPLVRGKYAKERTINNLNKLMFFLPSSSLLVDHITRYARSSRLEYNKKSY